jgi:hypothetical protein
MPFSIQIEAPSTFFTTKSLNLYCWTTIFVLLPTIFVQESASILHFIFLGSQTSQQGLINVAHPLNWAGGFETGSLLDRSPRRGVADHRRPVAWPRAAHCPACMRVPSRCALSRGLAQRTSPLARWRPRQRMHTLSPALNSCPSVCRQHTGNTRARGHSNTAEGSRVAEGVGHRAGQEQGVFFEGEFQLFSEGGVQSILSPCCQSGLTWFAWHPVS